LPGEWTLIDLQRCDEAPVQPRGEDWEEERAKEKEEVLEVADDISEVGEALNIPNLPGWEWIIDEDGKWDILFNDARVLSKTVYWWDTRLTGIGWVTDWNTGTIEGFGFNKPITADANRDEGPTNLLVKTASGDIDKSLQLWDYENKETLGWSMDRSWGLEGLPGSLPESIGPTTRPRTLDEAAAWFGDHYENKYGDKIHDFHFPTGTDEEVVEYWLSHDEEEAMPGGHWPRAATDSPYNQLSSSEQEKAVKKIFKKFRVQLMDGASMEVISETMFTLWMTDPWFMEALILYAKDWLKSAAGESDASFGAELWGILAQIWTGVSGATYTFPGISVGPYTSPPIVVDSAADVKTFFSAIADLMVIIAAAAPMYKSLWMNRRRGSLDNDLGALGITGPEGVEYPESEAGLPQCDLGKITAHIKDNIAKKGGVMLGEIHGRHAIPRYLADNIASFGIDVLFVECVNSPHTNVDGDAGGWYMDGQTALDAYMDYIGDPFDTAVHHNLRASMSGWTWSNGCLKYDDTQKQLLPGEPGIPPEPNPGDWDDALQSRRDTLNMYPQALYDEYINIFNACRDAGIAVVGINCSRDPTTKLFAGTISRMGTPLDPETGLAYQADLGYFDLENYPNHPAFTDEFGTSYQHAAGDHYEEVALSDTYMTSNQHWANVINSYLFNNPKPDGSDPKFIVHGGAAHTNGVIDVLDDDNVPVTAVDVNSVWNKYGGTNMLIYEYGYVGQAGIKKDIKSYDFITAACYGPNPKYYFSRYQDEFLPFHMTEWPPAMKTLGTWKRDGHTVPTAFQTDPEGKGDQQVNMIDTDLGAYEMTPCCCLYLSESLPRSVKFHGEAAAGEYSDLSKFSDYIIFFNGSNGPELGLFNDHNKEVAMDCTEMEALPKPPNQPTWGPFPGLT